jgi:hypothetical protein
MLDLADATDSLRFLVARPGMFDTLYPETTDDMLLQVLLDGLGECQLYGTLSTVTATVDGIIDPPLTQPQVALVVIFAALRFIRAELLNRNTSVVYKAGSADYETVQATNILRDIMKALQEQKTAMVALMVNGAGGAAAAFFMADQYVMRGFGIGAIYPAPMVGVYYGSGGSYDTIGW